MAIHIKQSEWLWKDWKAQLSSHSKKDVFLTCFPYFVCFLPLLKSQNAPSFLSCCEPFCWGGGVSRVGRWQMLCNNGRCFRRCGTRPQETEPGLKKKQWKYFFVWLTMQQQSWFQNVYHDSTWTGSDTRSDSGRSGRGELWLWSPLETFGQSKEAVFSAWMWFEVRDKQVREINDREEKHTSISAKQRYNGLISSMTKCVQRPWKAAEENLSIYRNMYSLSGTTLSVCSFTCAFSVLTLPAGSLNWTWPRPELRSRTIIMMKIMTH